jgi:hypothetical protein
MAKTKSKHFGQLPPRYGFMFNPYPDHRVSSCPLCEHKTGQRKIPLMVHIEPMHMIALNYTCRYCQTCDLLVANKPEVEHLLTSLFLQIDPTAIGNEYLVIGTAEKTAWKEGLQKQKEVMEMLPHISDFATYYQELRLTQGGWFHRDQEPPVIQPPPSQEWVKPKSRSYWRWMPTN